LKGISGRKLNSSTGSKRARRRTGNPNKVCQRIGNRNVGKSHVTRVGNREGIGNHVARVKNAVIAKGKNTRLVNSKGGRTAVTERNRLRVFGRSRVIDALRGITPNGSRVHNLAGVNICLL